MYKRETESTPTEALLERFRDVLKQVGCHISAADYDNLKLPDKPARVTLQERLGGGRKQRISWNQLKAHVAEPEEANPTYGALIRQNKALSEQLSRAKDIQQTLVDACLAAAAKLEAHPVKIPRVERAQEDQEFWALRSDAQVGQEVTAQSAQGLSTYSPQLYVQRLQEWVRKVCLFREQDRRSLGLNRLVVCHLGDQVEGERIYKGQPFEIALALSDQLMFSVEQEAGALLTLAGEFPSVEVYMVAGNHGRPGKPGEYHPRTNFDYLFYRVLSMYLRSQANIRFYVSECPQMLLDRGGFTLLLNHGDDVQSWMGIPYYGLQRGFHKVHELYDTVVDYELVGHFHSPANLGGKIVINGAFPGGSSFSVRQMRTVSRPSQRIFYFDEAHGMNRESNLWLADPVKLEPDQAGIYTPYTAGAVQ